MNLLHLHLIVLNEGIPFYRIPNKTWFQVVPSTKPEITPWYNLKPYKKISRVKVIDTSKRVEISFKREVLLQKMLCVLGKEPARD